MALKDEWDFEVEWEPPAEVPDGPIECFQFEKPVYTISDLEWAEIRALARQCLEHGMYGKDQFKIAIESYHRWISLTACNEELDKEYRSPPKKWH